ncbi:hypothetical protein BGW38_005428, partial [Lunasporangiospora selenospora]
LLTFLWVSGAAHAHSWLDCTNMHSSGKCAGYSLGYPSRENPDINTLYTYRIEGRPVEAPICQPGRQDILTAPPSPNFPSATIVAGQSLRLTWQANGHFNDQNATYVHVHWSKVPAQEKILRTRNELLPENRLASMPFATTGNCDQPSNPNTVCRGRVKIPAGTRPGRYQLVWWWPFDQNPVGEEYTSCFEVTVKERT